MVLQFVLLAGLAAAKGGAARLPHPDFAALLPPTPSTFFGRIHDSCDPERAEAVVLVKYLDRCWGHTASPDGPDDASNLITALRQFDSALLALNPNPTLREATARLGVYQPVLALVQREIERDDAHPKQLKPAQLCPLRTGRDQMNRRIAQSYGPLLVQAAFGMTAPLLLAGGL